MTRIIAIANQKGGVGKTTTAVNLAASLCAMKRRVLLIDLDPQGNATTGAGLDKRAQGNATVYQVLLGERSIADVRVLSPTGGFDIVPSNRDLAGAEIELVDLPERETRLKDALAEALSQMKSAIDEVARDYDFILLDCPPSLSLLTLNGLCAAHSVLIPMQCEYYALEGLSDLVQTLKKVRAHLNPSLEIEGLLRTMYDPRNTLAQNVTAELERHFGDKLFRTIIPRNVRLAEAPSHGIPALKLEAQSKGALAYLALAGEMLRRDEARGGKPRGGTAAAAGRGGGRMIRPKGLGRGLDALLSSGNADAPRTRRIADDRDRSRAARQAAAAHAHGRRSTRRARRVDQGARRDAADPRAARRRRPLRDHRGRTALARGAARGPARDPRAREERRRQQCAGARAHREHPAREPESARGSAGVARWSTSSG